MNAEIPPIDGAPAAERSRRGGRAGSRARGAAAFEQPPFRRLKNPLPPTKLVSDDELESIHLASLRVLKEIGVDVLHDQARAMMKAAGADVRDGSERVRFDADMILDLVAHCPSEFTLHARNPAHDVRFGGNEITFSMMASAPNCSDLDEGRRPGNQVDYRNFLRLAQMHNIIGCTGGYPVEPIDIHPSVRHLECIRDLSLLTDKVFHIYSLGRERNLDGIEIARIARGVSHEQMLEEPSVFTIINTNSPLKLDVPMMEGIIQMASPRPGRGGHAVYAGRRHGPGHGRRRAGAAERRGAGRHRLRPDGAQGCAGRLWRLHLERRHEVRAPRPSARPNT